jgi:hypothetical protein
MILEKKAANREPAHKIFEDRNEELQVTSR